METNEFVEKLLSQVSLETMDFASDVERILAEQVLFLRDQIHALRRETVLENHVVVRQLYERLAEKDEQIDHLREEVRFLRAQLDDTSS
jgi:hypothetical protein